MTGADRSPQGEQRWRRPLAYALFALAFVVLVGGPTWFVLRDDGDGSRERPPAGPALVSRLEASGLTPYLPTVAGRDAALLAPAKGPVRDYVLEYDGAPQGFYVAVLPVGESYCWSRGSGVSEDCSPLRAGRRAGAQEAVEVLRGDVVLRASAVSDVTDLDELAQILADAPEVTWEDVAASVR